MTIAQSISHTKESERQLEKICEKLGQPNESLVIRNLISEKHKELCNIPNPKERLDILINYLSLIRLYQELQLIEGETMEERKERFEGIMDTINSALREAFPEFLDYIKENFMG